MEELSVFLDLTDIGGLLLEAAGWLLRKLLKWENRAPCVGTVRGDCVSPACEGSAPVDGLRDPLLFGHLSGRDVILHAALPPGPYSSPYRRRLSRRRITRRRRSRARGH